MPLPLILALAAAALPLAAQTPRPTPAPSPMPSATPSPVPSTMPPDSSPTPIPALSPGAPDLAGPAPTPTPTATPTPSPTPDVADLVAEADGHFALRSFGAKDGIADPYEIDGAMILYRKALALAPTDIATLAKLMRAMHFRGAHTGAGLEEKKAIFDEGSRMGQQAVTRLEAEAEAARGMSRIEALRLARGAPALYLWTAGHWAEWGLARGKFAAARSGVAGRIRDLAQTVIDMDPLFEDAAGYRILGRLHSEAPKIIFITGWVSHNKALDYLRRAHQASPEHQVTRYFLAEAILDHEPANRDEAVRLLELCATTPPRPETVLEDGRYARMARQELDRLRGDSPGSRW